MDFMEKKEELKDKAREKSEAISKLYGKSYVIHQKNNSSQNSKYMGTYSMIRIIPTIHLRLNDPKILAPPATAVFSTISYI